MLGFRVVAEALFMGVGLRLGKRIFGGGFRALGCKVCAVVFRLQWVVTLNPKAHSLKATD